MIAFGVGLVLFAVTLSGCDKRPSAPPAAPSATTEPRWESVLDPIPDMLLVVRPRALLRDALYGPLLRRVVELARQRSSVVAAASALATLENADEVLVGAHDLRTADFVVVVRGVPADVDPSTLVDEQRRPLWTTSTSGPLHELTRTPSKSDEDDRSPVEASLFELPGRTWVIASGSECARTRKILSRPSAPSVPQAGQSPLDARLADSDPQAIASLRLAGPALVARFPALRPPGLLAPVGRELSTVTVLLLGEPDPRLRATFSYNRGTAPMSAEATLRETVAALSRAKPQTFTWLQTATVQSSRCCASLTLPLPPQVLGVLTMTPDGGA